MPERPSITSSEIGVLWMTYQQKTLILRMLEHFIEHADDDEAKNILVSLYEDVHPYVLKIEDIFKVDGAAVPIGFTKDDVNIGAPKLYENGFDILFVRLMKEISMGMHTLNITMAYRQDVVSLFRDLTTITQKYYDKCTHYLLEKGLLTRAPYCAMPEKTEFVKETNFLSGFNPFKEKRPLTTVEVAHLYHTVEANMVGMQMIIGFAQCANLKDVQQYFHEGSGIAKEIIKSTSQVLLDNDIHVPSSPGGNVTNSTAAPFSDKLMLYCISLFCSFSIGGSSIGTAFSLRNDIVGKTSKIMQDIFAYAHKGAKIMINHGFMEEPPQTKKKENKH